MIFHDEKIEVIILDDAYQHRSVKPHLNILLNDYYRPFYQDYVLPSGLLREARNHAKRADIVVVTKCPEELEKQDMDHVEQQIVKYSGQTTPVYFTGIKYLQPQRLFGTQNFSENVLLFTGIANASPLENFVEKHYNLLGHRKYSDHHSFTKEDLTALIKSFEEINFDHKCLLTTEKDMVRLISMEEETRFLKNYPVFYLPIELYFLKNGDCFAIELENKVKIGLKELVTNE
jgi:tetraacyldisaccharide 4'-kinase